MSFLGSRMFAPRLWMAVILVGVLVGLVPSPARAQVADAVIEVLAQDESQAVLPGVTVTVTRPDTGFTQTNVTDASGVGRASSRCRPAPTTSRWSSPASRRSTRKASRFASARRRA